MGPKVRWDKVGPVDPSARGTPTSAHRIPLNENDVVVPCAQFWIQPDHPCTRGEVGGRQLELVYSERRGLMFEIASRRSSKSGDCHDHGRLVVQLTKIIRVEHIFSGYSNRAGTESISSLERSGEKCCS